MSEFDELKKLAEAATPGLWVINDEHSIDEGGPHLMTADGYAIADFWGNDSSLGLKKNEQNATYIASASPETILALIARLEAAESELERLRSQEPVGKLRETIDVLMQEVGNG